MPVLGRSLNLTYCGVLDGGVAVEAVDGGVGAGALATVLFGVANTWEDEYVCVVEGIAPLFSFARTA
jgi:hypothetical protein